MLYALRVDESTRTIGMKDEGCNGVEGVGSLSLLK